ncbi:hypothetical protein [Oerskovia flava]|uniref:hypothetical protein n=1 Tax=Oerskovia flava TaxID=2986422 RepID=UPI002240DCFD|nr:hypothetical protein [Oerskovia sp. JB1-3-2]
MRSAAGGLEGLPFATSVEGEPVYTDASDNPGYAIKTTGGQVPITTWYGASIGGDLAWCRVALMVIVTIALWAVAVILVLPGSFSAVVTMNGMDDHVWERRCGPALTIGLAVSSLLTLFSSAISIPLFLDGAVEEWVAVGVSWYAISGLTALATWMVARRFEVSGGVASPDVRMLRELRRSRSLRFRLVLALAAACVSLVATLVARQV